MHSVNGLFAGSRFNIWKQDPTVKDLGVRKTFIPSNVMPGPSDTQVIIDKVKMPLIQPNIDGDFLFSVPNFPIVDNILNIPPIEDKDRNFDAAHTYAVVRQVTDMYEQVLNFKLKWAWNFVDENTGIENSDPLKLSPHDNMGKKVYYDRTSQSLKFEYFYIPGKSPFFTCRSADIISHETGHAVLDAIKPRWGTTPSGESLPVQAGALHESFGDLSSIFYMLYQFDLIDYIIVQTKSDLHKKNVLSTWSELLEQMPDIGPRNADNNLTIQEAGTSVHKLSQVFTGAIYDCLVDVFESTRDVNALSDNEALYMSGRYMLKLLMDSVVDAPDSNINFTTLANIIINKAEPQYKDFMRHHFKVRDVLADDLISTSASMNNIITANVRGDYSGSCATFNRSSNNE